jgi:HAD superfamily hydrolase (TIGR01549 family)
LISVNGVRAILFDLDGTLRHNDPSSTETFFDYAVMLGATDSAERRKSATRWTHYYWAQSPEMLADLEHFQSVSPELWTFYSQRVLVKFGCTPAQAKALAPEVHRCMAEEYKPLDIVREDVIPALETLKAAGFGLGVVSNRDEPFEDYLATLNLHKHFDLALAAGEINAWKPEPEIFLYAVQQLQLTPGQALYVGDNYYADILGARGAGLQPVLLDSDQVFPNPGCPVIRKISDLLTLLEK